jgi:acetolactate synthase I/II/III large subunit
VSRNRKPWRAICEALAEERVEFVFGLPGNPELLYNDLYDFPQVKPILVRHETSAVFMAMGYARASGRVGVVHASPGPGMANLVPGLLEAHYACSPLVSLVSAADRNYEGMGVFQETPSLDLARPVSKWAVRIDLPHRTTWTLERAFQLARTGKPGPVFVEVPADVAGSEAEIPAYRRPFEELRAAGDPAAVAAAAELLANAERPVIVAGGGVGLSGAEAALVALAERLQAPVVTTPSGRGSISESHPLAFGAVGLYRTESSARPYDQSDAVLFVGTRMEEFQSGLWKLVPGGARFVQVDVDPFEIGRNIRPDAAVVGDSRLVLEQLAARVPAVASRPWTVDCIAFREEFEARVDRECAAEGPVLKTKQIVHALNDAFGDYVLVNENGGQDLWSYYCPYAKVTAHRGCVAPAEQTCMGFGVAAAVGAKLARPEAHVVCVTGDGAFQMYMQELATAVQYRAPVVWIVLNNASLGWCKWIQRATGERYLATDFEAQVDFVAVAQACGAHAERLDAPAQVHDALRRAREACDSGVPAVLDCTIDTWDYPPGFTDFHRDVWGLELPARADG